MAMRRFRVGDRVRWENRVDGTPRWNFSQDRGLLTLSCVPASGVVIATDPYDFTVRSDDGEGWAWPQPDHPQACYGAPGYLELVETVENQKRCAEVVEQKHNEVELATSISAEQMRDTIKKLGVKKADVDASLDVKAKSITVKELTEMVEKILLTKEEEAFEECYVPEDGSLIWANDFFRKIDAECAQAIAEALAGTKIEEK